MTDITIQKKIEAIQRITSEALKSREAATKILTDAGILKKDKEVKKIEPKKKEE
ncbi:MAG TPA: hypothetical protein VHZ50_12945 [Puia sp.]|jgi:hypothetical protein|nr:hypothetical protein [Puia sp.]